MELHVELSLPGEDAEEMDTVVGTLGDIDKIAARVTRSVRNYLRTVAVRNQVSAFRFELRAQWRDSAKAPATNGHQPAAEKARSHHGPKSGRKHKD